MRDSLVYRSAEVVLTIVYNDPSDQFYYQYKVKPGGNVSVTRDSTTNIDPTDAAADFNELKQGESGSVDLNTETTTAPSKKRINNMHERIHHITTVNTRNNHAVKDFVILDKFYPQKIEINPDKIDMYTKKDVSLFEYLQTSEDTRIPVAVRWSKVEIDRYYIATAYKGRPLSTQINVGSQYQADIPDEEHESNHSVSDELQPPNVTSKRSYPDVKFKMEYPNVKLKMAMPN